MDHIESLYKGNRKKKNKVKKHHLEFNKEKSKQVKKAKSINQKKVEKIFE